MSSSELKARLAATREKQAASAAANRDAQGQKHRGAVSLGGEGSRLSNRERIAQLKAKRSGLERQSSAVRPLEASRQLNAGAPAGPLSGGGGGADAEPLSGSARSTRKPTLASLLGAAGLLHRLRQFKEHGVTFDVLAEATDEDLRELVEDPSLELKVGERQALKNSLRRFKAQGQQDGGLAGAGGAEGRDAALADADSEAVRSRAAPLAGAQADGEAMRAPLVLTSSWEVDDFSEIEYDGQAGYLSKGVSGSVFRAQWQGQNCALKIFNYAGGDQEVEAAFQNELDILRKLNHGNLVRFFAACTKPPPDGQLGILMELMDGSLASLLYGKASTGPSGKRHEMSDKRLVAIAYGISNGMRFLHKNHICHRDLKSHNVLYDKQLNIKLCDFAFSKFKATLEKKSVRFESRVGTPQWMAPEVLRGEEYTFSADVYSFGVILWEMISRQQPFADFHAMAVMFKVGTEGLRLTPPDDCPPFWQRLMEACWLPPRERPTFEKVFQLIRQVKQQLDRNPKLGFKDGLGADLLAGGC